MCSRYVRYRLNRSLYTRVIRASRWVQRTSYRLNSVRELSLCSAALGYLRARSLNPLLSCPQIQVEWSDVCQPIVRSPLTGE